MFFKGTRLAAAFAGVSLITSAVSTALDLQKQELGRGRAILIPVPQAFGTWVRVNTQRNAVNLQDNGEGTSNDLPYDAVTNTTFADTNGRRVNLTLAYRESLDSETKIHRPELCYFAQGYVVSHKFATPIPVGNSNLP